MANPVENDEKTRERRQLDEINRGLETIVTPTEIDVKTEVSEEWSSSDEFLRRQMMDAYVTPTERAMVTAHGAARRLATAAERQSRDRASRQHQLDYEAIESLLTLLREVVLPHLVERIGWQ